MTKLFSFIALLFLFASANAEVFAQDKSGVEVIPRISVKETSKSCKNFGSGQVVFFHKPEYPVNAENSESNQTVNITILIDEMGFFTGIEKAEGKSPFLEIGIKAAQKVKFTPTNCDGKPIPVKVVMTYIFNPIKVGRSYFIPESIKEFKDIDKNSEFYEPILFLTENYKIAFGYEDKMFHENLFLTKGDFAQFLLLTLDFLSERAKFANKDPLKIKLFRPFNPVKLDSMDQIKNLEKDSPSSDSTKKLFEKYGIALADLDFEFKHSTNITQNELIEIWSGIFGNEALPIHFDKTSAETQNIKRGEFALFLQESLRVLTYKVLP